MVFDYKFNVWDIIWLFSLIVWIINLFLIKPIYNHYHYQQKNVQNYWGVIINWWKPYKNVNIVQNFRVSNKPNNLVIIGNSNEW